MPTCNYDPQTQLTNCTQKIDTTGWLPGDHVQTLEYCNADGTNCQTKETTITVLEPQSSIIPLLGAGVMIVLAFVVYFVIRAAINKDE